MVRILFLSLLALGNLALFYGLLVSDQGLWSYLELRARRADLAEELDLLEDRSRTLSQEILWFREDAGYREKIIREQTNFLKDNEVLYILPEQDAWPEETTSDPDSHPDE